jgi:hypothetical protein
VRITKHALASQLPPGPRDLTPALARARERLHVLPSGRTLATTVPAKRTREEWRAASAQETPIEYPADVRRPRWRSECNPCPTCQEWRDSDAEGYPGRLACGHSGAQAVAHSRPCVFVGCERTLYLDVNPDTGSIKFNFPVLEPDEMRESCAEDLADRGGMALEEVGRAYNLTRERIRQIEVIGLGKIEDRGGDDLGLMPERGE